MDLKELKKTFKLIFPERDEYSFDWYEGADSVYVLCPVKGSNYYLTYYAAFIDLAHDKAIIHCGEYHSEIYKRLHKLFILTLCTRKEITKYETELEDSGLDRISGDVYGIKPRY